MLINNFAKRIISVLCCMGLALSLSLVSVNTYAAIPAPTIDVRYDSVTYAPDTVAWITITNLGWSIDYMDGPPFQPSRYYTIDGGDPTNLLGLDDGTVFSYDPVEMPYGFSVGTDVRVIKAFSLDTSGVIDDPSPVVTEYLWQTPSPRRGSSNFASNLFSQALNMVQSPFSFRYGDGYTDSYNDEENYIGSRLYFRDETPDFDTRTVPDYGTDIVPEKTNTLEVFQKYFSNNLFVLHCYQDGDFGQNVNIAVKLKDETDVERHIYSYNAETNTYTEILTEYFIDENNFLHFTTPIGGDLVISDGELTLK